MNLREKHLVTQRDAAFGNTIKSLMAKKPESGFLIFPKSIFVETRMRSLFKARAKSNKCQHQTKVRISNK